MLELVALVLFAVVILAMVAAPARASHIIQTESRSAPALVGGRAGGKVDW